MRLSLSAVCATLCLMIAPLCASDALASHSRSSGSHAHHRASSSAHTRIDKNVRDAQLYLAKLGYKVGKADGVMGKKTKAAIIKYQTAHKLHATGKVSITLMRSLVMSARKRFRQY